MENLEFKDITPENILNFLQVFSADELNDLINCNNDNTCAHRHVLILDPILKDLYEFPEGLTVTWVYVLNEQVHSKIVRLKDVPIFGLVIPTGFNQVVQVIPRGGKDGESEREGRGKGSAKDSDQGRGSGLLH